jgi:serine/threonine-protein kinase
MPEWTGRKIGKVEINDLIARGGMAEIYTGMHETHGLVAVKVMRGLLERDIHQLARFKREADVISELRHPNIVRMIDYVVEDETPCLIMDYIPGPTLATYMKNLHDRNKRIPIVIVAQLLRSIASALDHAHSKGIVHRDIKPANVLLRSPSQEINMEHTLPLDVEPILTDFGLVRLLDSTLHTTSGSVSGTPTYMSPEQSRGEKVDSRTDIYSLGVMLYEMITGFVPFQAETTFGMLMKHINEPPPPIKGISMDIQALLDRALAKDPDVRYQTAGEMANEFLSIFNGQNASSDTRYFAEVARKAVESTNAKTRTEEPPRFPWKRIAVEVGIAIILALVIVRFVCPCIGIP